MTTHKLPVNNERDLEIVFTGEEFYFLCIELSVFFNQDYNTFKNMTLKELRLWMFYKKYLISKQNQKK